MSRSGGFELVPLDCPTCGAGVEAEGNDVVFYCVACRNGYSFDDEARRLVPVEVAFVAAAHVSAERYLPFWQLPATISIRRRSAAGRQFSGIVSSFVEGLSGRSVGRGTPLSAKTDFLVPAFEASLAATTELLRRYTRALPTLGEKLGERLVGGCFGVGDAEKLAHFTLIASEVDKPDMLKSLDYKLEFQEARLLGVPFVRRDDGWADSLHGIRI